MTGCSYGGTLPFEVATSGVKGLRTIIPFAGIASWYDYTNSQGAPLYLDADYANKLAAFNSGAAFLDDDWTVINDDYASFLWQLAEDQKATNGNYGEIWSKLDYSVDASKINCSALIVHGMNDFNVCTKHSDLMARSFAKAGQEFKLVLHQDGHNILNGVIVNGPIEISLPIGDTSDTELPLERDENGNNKKPEKGMITFTFDAGDIQSRVKTYHPDKETATPEVTAKVREAAFTPLMSYIYLDLQVNPDAMAAFIAENGEFVKDEDGTELWPYTPMDLFEHWVWSLELVDGSGNLIFPDQQGCEACGSDSADFIYPYLEELPDELYLAPVEMPETDDDGNMDMSQVKVDMTQAVLVKPAD